MDWQILGETYLTLVVIMDPVGLVPVFIAVTARLSPGQRRRAAVRATVAAGALMIGFALVGRFLLEYLNVSVEALSISGGLLLLLVALEMLRGLDEPEDASSEDVALVPLATPLVAGPGAIATIIVLVQQNTDVGERAGVGAGLLLALATIGAALLAAQWLARVLPASFVSLLTRVFGVLLSAIAVQLVVDGIRGLS
jgi:multiple antibiotic resistance protein